MTSPAKVRALFLDRDGVVNHEVGYLHRSEDVRWVDGIIPLCLTAQSLGYKLIVVTNQSGIARGYYTMEQYEDLTAWIRAQLAQQGITLNGVYCCPYHPEGLGEYRGDHEDRKPNPGMLRRAAIDHWIDLSQSIMIGDRCSDMAAANAAGLREAFLLRGTEPEPCPENAIIVESLAEVEAWLKK